MPRAAPRAIRDRISQFNGVLPAPLFPEQDEEDIDMSDNQTDRVSKGAGKCEIKMKDNHIMEIHQI